MKKLFTLACVGMVLLLTGCIGGGEIINEPDGCAEGETMTDAGDCVPDNQICEYGYNQYFEICLDPTINTENFMTQEVTYGKENIDAKQMITNIEYNYLTGEVEFDVSFISDLDVYSIKAEVESEEVVYSIDSDSKDYLGVSFSAQSESTKTYNEHFEFDGLILGRDYEVIVTYVYYIGPSIVQENRLSAFTVNATEYEDRDIPTVVGFELLSSTTNSVEVTFKIVYNGSIVDGVEIRVFNPETEEYIGVTRVIDIAQYKEQYRVYVPSIIIDGLERNTEYDIQIFFTGTDGVDYLTNVLLHSMERGDYMKTKLSDD